MVACPSNDHLATHTLVNMRICSSIVYSFTGAFFETCFQPNSPGHRSCAGILTGWTDEWGGWSDRSRACLPPWSRDTDHLPAQCTSDTPCTGRYIERERSYGVIGWVVPQRYTHILYLLFHTIVWVFNSFHSVGHCIGYMNRLKRQVSYRWRKRKSIIPNKKTLSSLSKNPAQNTAHQEPILQTASAPGSVTVFFRPGFIELAIYQLWQLG